MLALIGDYKFEMNGTNVEKIKESYTFGWSRADRLYNNPLHMKKGAYAKSITISGTLIMKKINILDGLINLAKTKTPVSLVIEGSSDTHHVVILSIDIDKDTFLHTGEEMRKNFSMKVEEYYGKV